MLHCRNGRNERVGAGSVKALPNCVEMGDRVHCVRCRPSRSGVYFGWPRLGGWVGQRLVDTAAQRGLFSNCLTLKCPSATFIFAMPERDWKGSKG